MIFHSIRSKLFWTVLLYYFSMILGVAFRREAKGHPQLFFRIKQGVRSQRKVFTSLRATTSIHCTAFCLDEKTCISLNYAEPAHVNDDEENCELHNETKNDDENPLEFLKDDRYTFYEATNPPLNRSCLDNFNRGGNTSGNYIIFDWEQKRRKVYCDMESEPGSVWTLVVSFTRANKELTEFRSKAMYKNAGRKQSTPNWFDYRMYRTIMTEIKRRATHWRITCSFPQYSDDIYTDYVRAAFIDFDLMGKFWDECKKVSYINVMGQSCSECTAHWWQNNVNTPHIAAVQNDVCDIKSDKSGNHYFGAYSQYNPTFRCTEYPNSTTNYWFGTYV